MLSPFKLTPVSEHMYPLMLQSSGEEDEPGETVPGVMLCKRLSRRETSKGYPPARAAATPASSGPGRQRVCREMCWGWRRGPCPAPEIPSPLAGAQAAGCAGDVAVRSRGSTEGTPYQPPDSAAPGR